MLYVSAGSLYLFPYNHIEVIDKVEGSVFSDRDPPGHLLNGLCFL